MAKNKGRVTNTVDSKKNTLVTNPNSPLKATGKMTFDFSYVNWLKGVSRGEFTNMLKDEFQFTAYMVEFFTKIIPIISQNWDNLIKYNGGAGGGFQFRHCHTINDEKLKLVKEIVEQIHGKPLCDEVENDDLNYWQLGLIQSLRVISIYSNNNNTLFPVFLDYHHQIYPDDWHNQEDIESYEHCPINRYA